MPSKSLITSAIPLKYDTAMRSLWSHPSMAIEREENSSDECHWNIFVRGDDEAALQGRRIPQPQCRRGIAPSSVNAQERYGLINRWGETTSGVVGIRQPRCREMQTTNQTNYDLIIRGLLRLLGYAIVRHKTVQTVPKTWGVRKCTSSPPRLCGIMLEMIPQRNQEK